MDAKAKFASRFSCNKISIIFNNFFVFINYSNCLVNVSQFLTLLTVLYLELFQSGGFELFSKSASQSPILA